MNHNNDDTWADFLSSAAQPTARDQASTDHVLNALRLERQENPTWNAYLSSGAVLRPIDLKAVQPTLVAIKLERLRVLRLNLTRAVAGLAAAATVAAGFVFLNPTTSADANEAYTVYQEASTGW